MYKNYFINILQINNQNPIPGFSKKAQCLSQDSMAGLQHRRKFG